MRSQPSDSNTTNSPNRNASEHRKTTFKNKDRFSLNQIKRRRRLNEIELRKQKRTSSITRQRNELFLRDLYTSKSIFATTASSAIPAYNESELVDIQTAFESPDTPLELKLERIQRLCELASTETKIADSIIRAGFHNELKKLIWSEHPFLKTASITALRILASASPEYAVLIAEDQVTQELVGLLNASSETGANIDLSRQALYLLMTVTGELQSIQIQVLDQGGLNGLFTYMEVVHPHALQDNPFDNSARQAHFDERVAACFVHNLLKPAAVLLPESSILNDIRIAALLNYFLEFIEEDVIAESCQTLASITSASSISIELLLKHSPHLGPRLVKLLSTPLDPSTQSAIVRALGNITLGPDTCTDNVLSWDTLSVFRPLLLPPTQDSLRKEVCWAIANIVAGSKREYIEAVIDNNLVPPLIKILGSDGVLTNTKREACWAVCNILSNEHVSLNQIKYLVSQGCLPPLANEMIQSLDNSVVLISLEALQNVLQAGDVERQSLNTPMATNQYAEYIEEAYGVGNINQLVSTTTNDQIFAVSCQIIDRFFTENGASEQPTPASDSKNESRSTSEMAPIRNTDDDEMSDVQSVSSDKSNIEPLEPENNGRVFVFSSGDTSLSPNNFSFQ